MPHVSVAWAELFGFSMKLAALCPYTKSGGSRSSRQKHGNVVRGSGHSAAHSVQSHLWQGTSCPRGWWEGGCIAGCDRPLWLSHLAWAAEPSQVCDMSQQPQSSAGKELLLGSVSNACNSRLVEEHKLTYIFFKMMVKQIISLMCAHACMGAC